MAVRKGLVDALVAASNAPDSGVDRAAFVIAEIEYPQLDVPAYIARLDEMGEEARAWIARHSDSTGDTSPIARVNALNAYLFGEQRFAGDRERYEDPRNSCLNQVIDRRRGIPITLSVVYMEVGRRAGLEIDGVNFPGHFLVRVPSMVGKRPSGLIVDPFHGGVLLSEHNCRTLLEQHAGPEMTFRRSLMAPATRTQILVRMLLNLKRIYMHMRSFPQARDVTDLLLALTPSALGELRDRGLLAYHLYDVSAALRDLQTYLKLASMGEATEDTQEEHKQLWEHVKTLRRRVAGLN
jgi:regulator of sirC expression with transglutaminase-like and TPR domain